jgi:hypothetical protein
MSPPSIDKVDTGDMMAERRQKRHVVVFSRNFKIDERDYLTMEEVLRDAWLVMASNGFYCETTLDATRSLVKTTTRAVDDERPCEYRIQTLKVLPFVTAVPHSVLKLDALKVLDLSENASIEYLPPWIGKVCNLEHLNLSFTKGLRELPDEIGQLSKLERLDLVDSGIAVLPNTLYMLRSLKSLDLRGCEELQGIPGSIGALKNLQELDLYSTTKLQWLPEEIGRLKKLHRLNLSYSNILYLPFSMGKLKSLEELDLSSTKHLATIPEDISKLKKLHRLNLSYSSISSIPDKIGRLKQLECLNLHQCRNLKRLPESVRSLERSIAFRNSMAMKNAEDDREATFDIFQPLLCM